MSKKWVGGIKRASRWWNKFQPWRRPALHANHMFLFPRVTLRFSLFLRLYLRACSSLTLSLSVCLSQFRCFMAYNDLQQLSIAAALLWQVVERRCGWNKRKRRRRRKIPLLSRQATQQRLQWKRLLLLPLRAPCKTRLGRTLCTF